jgi:hypothetical protein
VPVVQTEGLPSERPAQHEPQVAADSQPFDWRFESQSTQPSAQWPAHTPDAQTGTGTLLPEQTVPHAPQLFGSVARSTGQPCVWVVPVQFA